MEKQVRFFNLFGVVVRDDIGGAGPVATYAEMTGERTMVEVNTLEPVPVRNWTTTGSSGCKRRQPMALTSRGRRKQHRWKKRLFKYVMEQYHNGKLTDRVTRV